MELNEPEGGSIGPHREDGQQRRKKKPTAHWGRLLMS
jgi:hypothetical protein